MQVFRSERFPASEGNGYQFPDRNRQHGRRQGQAGVAALLLLGGIVAFYVLGRLDLWVRVVRADRAGRAGRGRCSSRRSPGKQLIGFGKESVKEVKKVVWPTRKEALQNTAMVFAFVFLMALFLWITDKTLEFVLYDLILGWKR
jgi:preprotein translocase subunit SecE